MTKIRGGLRLGIDVGSTTVKLAVVDWDGKILYTDYRRHYARQMEAVIEILENLAGKKQELFLPCREGEDTKESTDEGKRGQITPEYRMAVCGSGGKPVAEALGVHYIQEVVANAAAVETYHPQAKTAVELGGQDAKVLFFGRDEATGHLFASDMRMNGSCAGGTGAFLDEIAALLDVPCEEMEPLAQKGREVYKISGRCGVFAKTDIQPLLIEGASREDIVLSAFHAIARQTIGGLSQGLTLEAPVLFEGGPLNFHPTLIRVFAEHLNLKEEEILVPEHPGTIVAAGSVLALEKLYPEEKEGGRTDEAKDLNREPESESGLKSDRMSVSEAILRLKEALKKRKLKKEKEQEENRESLSGTAGRPYFLNRQEQKAFMERHNRELKTVVRAVPSSGNVLPVYLGVDSGSTTSKMVLLDENENVVASYYAPNQGEALEVVKKGLDRIYSEYHKEGIELKIIGAGTTGYGERLCAKALGADIHMVETVAHSTAGRKYVPDVTFILDIGGQDMKAIWMKNGVIANILLNEACSSGCGSFLENFSASLNIPAEKIAEAAFSSKSPARLGSRCTVFMNSTIITEQRNGKSNEDIMAGLCRSVIENVFTKVVRIANTDQLGSKILVQGGTFRNFAVLKALEDYIGREVILAPYPGEMGAIGAALLAKQQAEREPGRASSFIGFDRVKELTYKKESGVACSGCSNSCKRTITYFSTGAAFVTGNRCERGEIHSEPEEKASADAQNQKGPGTCDVRVQKHRSSGTESRPVNLFAVRQKNLFREYPCRQVHAGRDCVIGIPRVLEFYDSMPFWSTFFRALGFTVKFSHESNTAQYEAGISFVASDTVCFPAKLVHGHIRDLAEQKVDRIFFPYVMHMPPEGKDKLSPYVCSVLMGYPMVIRNFQAPDEKYGVIFDTPVFHWFSEKNREEQILNYAVETLGTSKKEAKEAFCEGKRALQEFRGILKDKAEEAMKTAREQNSWAVVLAGRPYHTDAFVNHHLPELFIREGISVLTVDSLPGLDEVDLHRSRVEITNNFHTRMLAGAYLAAGTDVLEYAQIVSFGCGHDAILSDEITRIVTGTSDKTPLILKVDESQAGGALNIRVKSFVETVRIRREKGNPLKPPAFREIPDAYPVKFYKKDKKDRLLLIPNISEEAAVLLKAVMEKEGLRPVTMPIGGMEQIQKGKRYSHNDICFPCQMVIGELLCGLDRYCERGYSQDELAVGMVKFQCDCRMSHYAALLRKALDAAGYQRVPVVTTDVNDTKDMHPGVFLLGISAILEAVWGFLMLDILQELRRRIRPYEVCRGETDRVVRECLEKIGVAMQKGLHSAVKEFEVCIERLKKIRIMEERNKPRVFITGELLVTYHPGSNFQIERYMEANGMETIFPRITDQLRKDFTATECEISEFHARIFPYPWLVTALFDSAQKKLEKIAASHPLFEPGKSPKKMYEGVRDIIPETLSCGEGWLMAAEINHYASEGVRSFVILQPFGCLPNHICGRGVTKKLKTRYPGIQILPLDLDPDTSFANVENRLQMLIMNQKMYSCEDEDDKEETVNGQSNRN